MTDKKNSFRAHPFMMFSYLKPFLFVLLLPLLKALVQYIFDRKISSIVVGESVAAAILVTYALAKWRSFRITIEKDCFYIRSGIFVFSQAKVPFEKVSTVEVLRNPLDAIFRSATVRINTEAGRKGKADFEFRVSLSAAKEIYNAAGEPETATRVKFSALKIALMAAATSSAATGMIVAVPIINQSGKLFGMALQDVLLERINDVSRHFEKYVPPIVNTVTIVFLALYAFGFLYSLLKNINFKISLGKQKIQVSSGFFERKNITFKKRAVNNVCIEQTPLMWLVDRCLVQVGIGGYGGGKGERAIVIPSVKLSRTKAELAMMFPNIEWARKNVLKPHQKSLPRYMLLPFYWLLGALAAYFLFVSLFPSFKELILFLTAIFMCILLYYFYLARYNFLNAEISFGEIVYIRHSKWANIKEMYCEAKKIGVITVTRFPADSIFSTCNVKITIRSEASDSLMIKHIPYEQALSRIRETYSVEKW